MTPSTTQFALQTSPTVAVKTARLLTSGDDGNYTLTVTATQNGTSVHSNLPVTVSPVVSGAIGFSANVQLFGAATYNSDGTVSGLNGVAGTAPNGTVYNFNPDSPDAHTTAHNRGTFTSDFAGFSCSSIECTRDDTALRVIFRKDLTGSLAGRVEMILEMGHPTTGGTAVNLGAFTLQILNAVGTPCNIAVYTKIGAGMSWVPNANTLASGAKLVTKMYAPQMGWFSRWRTWTTDGANFYRDAAHVRPEARSPDINALGPSGLNLLPQFSAAQAAKVRAPNTGTSGGFFTALWPSSAYTIDGFTSFGNTNYNPSGMNETGGMRIDTGGVGDGPEIGLINEYSANYLINGNTNARTSMYSFSENVGCYNCCVRDLSTGAPADQVTNTTFDPDRPGYINPSTGDTIILEANHMPETSYVPYLLTGDPYYLESKQFLAGFHLIWNRYHRDNGYLLNYLDPNSPVAANPSATIPMFTSYERESRGWGWAMRDFGQALVSTPASVPGWLLSKSYHQSVFDQNLTYAQNNSGCPAGTGSNNTYYKDNYPHLTLIGQGPGAWWFDQGYFVAYKLIGMAFAVNQAGRSNWLNYLTYAARFPIGVATNTDKTVGWPANNPAPHEYAPNPYSTDYLPNPVLYTSFADTWNYFWGSNLYAAVESYWAIGNFPAWQSGHAYTCNSWIVETRMFYLDPPNTGDIVSLTISGSFAGSPVTVTHTLSAGDVSWIIAHAGWAPDVSTSPILDDLISKINSSAAGSGGVHAAYTNGASSGYYWTTQSMNRIYLTLTGVTISVTGSYSSAGPNNASSLWIQPNGDGVHNGTAGTNLLGRGLNYQCAATGTSAGSGGPTGQSFTTLVNDNTCKWQYVPEYKNIPTVVPTLKSFAAYPHPAQQTFYTYWFLAAIYMLKAAGITGASTCAANVDAVMVQAATDDSSMTQRFSYAITG